MRGKRQVGGVGGLVLRLIPAHAGKTRAIFRRPRCTEAHPRSCGENAKPDPHRLVEPGSSPLMRGKLTRGTASCVTRGLIPAHAGKTVSLALVPAWCWAHPRSCGENNWEAGLSCLLTGSSPLMRGKPPTSPPTCATCGLIPAHAGKTRRPQSQFMAIRAHPRSCGENEVGACAASWPRGSSPLMRGKLGPRRRRSARPRLIPAHAGKTWLGCESAKTVGAHPRSCGENSTSDEKPARGMGSSPLMRGKRTTTSLRSMRWGLIPAHAGKTEWW